MFSQVTLALGNVLLPLNLIEEGLNNHITRDGLLGFWFSEYAVTIMLFKLSLVLQEGSADKA